MAQVVGRQCVICRKGIYDLLTGQPCETCGHPVHRECAERFQPSGAGCARCGGDPATAPGPETGRRQTGSGELVPFVIGLVVILTLGGLWVAANFLSAPGRRPEPKPSADQRGADGSETASDPIAILETSEGTLKVRLHRTLVPETANNFIELANKGVYRDIKFHRIISNFMAQTGDPTGTGSGGRTNAGLPPKKLRDEFHPRLRHDRRGVLSMANAGPNTGDCQFFILFGPAAHLDNRHAVFGEVIEGSETLDKLERTRVVADERGEMSKPVTPPILKSVRIEDPKQAKPAEETPAAPQGKGAAGKVEDSKGAAGSGS